jgi:hypothetical protein
MQSTHHLGHRSAAVAADCLAEILNAVELPPMATDVDLTTTVAYTRLCLYDERGLLLLVEGEMEEREAALGATWVVTQARRAGALPPSGAPFLSEHRMIDATLGRGMWPR